MTPFYLIAVIVAAFLVIVFVAFKWGKKSGQSQGLQIAAKAAAEAQKIREAAAKRPTAELRKRVRKSARKRV